jgi:hypothetical protein
MDVNRRHRERHEKWDNLIGDNKEKETNFISKKRYESIAIFECITHHCRTCQYGWETEVLPNKMVSGAGE